LFSPITKPVGSANLRTIPFIFVDDGSTDGTREKIRALTTAYRVRLIERDGAERRLAGAIIIGANVRLALQPTAPTASNGNATRQSVG
jgi:hypothetical protein